MLQSQISFPLERTKQLLLNKNHQNLFKHRNYGITNKQIFSILNRLFLEDSFENSSNSSDNTSKMQHFTSYNSFIALKTIYIEENKPESLLSAYLEIDLMEKTKKEFSKANHEFLKIIAYRNIPLVYHRNIRVIEILYEKTLSLYYPYIIKECPNLIVDEDYFDDENFHKVFDFMKNKFNFFQGNLIHEINCKYAEFRIDIYSGFYHMRIHSFLKQHVARRYFFDIIPFIDQYVNKYYQHFSLDKIWSEYFLSSFYRMLGDDTKAKEKLETILDLFQRIYGSEHLENSDILMSLSNIVAPKNQIQALEYIEQALKLRLKYLSPDHLKVAYAYMNLGSLLMGMKLWDKSMNYFEKALKGFEKYYSEDYPWDSLGYTLFCLGNIHLEKQNLKRSLYFYKSSLRVYNHFIIPNDIMVVTIYGIMNKICGDNGNFIEGYTYSMQALKIIKHEFGAENEKYKIMKKSIKGQKKYKEISIIMNEAMAMDKRLRKDKVFKRKEIISDILSHFSF